jgi:hypothetical protein
VAGLSAHGIFDFLHGHLVSNPGVPLWWPQFCLAYDLATAGFFAWLQVRRNLQKYFRPTKDPRIDSYLAESAEFARLILKHLW